MSWVNTVPVLPGFHSDPTACHVDGRWYLAVSSFEYFPAAPIYTSEDLTRWEQIGHIVNRVDQIDLTGTADSMGLFGSTLRHHDGRFWFVTTDVPRFDRGTLLFTADNPAGPWSAPVSIPGAVGIDPDIAWDEDGVALLTWTILGTDGRSRIAQADLDPATGALRSPIRFLWSGTGMRNPEGPHLYRIGDWWYLLIAEGGTDRGHAVSIARSRQPRGEFEGAPTNPILTHRSTAHVVQSTGHADLVPGPDARWHIVYHGTRPAGRFPEFHVLGRETFAADVTFDIDGWPVITERDRPTLPGPFFTDTFQGTDLALRWVTPGAAQPLGQLTNGGLLMTERPGNRPLVTRVQHEQWQAYATLQADSGAARLLLRLDDRHSYAVEVSGHLVTALVTIGGIVSRLGAVEVPQPGPVTAVLQVTRSPSQEPAAMGEGPDLVQLACMTDGRLIVLAEVDGRYLSTEVAGGFTGRMVGLEHVSGEVTVSEIGVQPLHTPLPTESNDRHRPICSPAGGPEQQ